MHQNENDRQSNKPQNGCRTARGMREGCRGADITHAASSSPTTRQGLHSQLRHSDCSNILREATRRTAAVTTFTVSIKTLPSH